MAPSLEITCIIMKTMWKRGGGADGDINSEQQVGTLCWSGY